MTAPLPPGAISSQRMLHGAAWLAGLAVQGYVIDHDREGDDLVVELLLDGVPHGIARADLYDATLAEQDVRNPFHGFLFTLPQTVFERAATAEVRLANDGDLIGRPLSLLADSQPLAATLGPGSITWTGGLRFGGWLAPDAPPDAVVRGMIDENKVVEARAGGWIAIDRDGTELAVRGVDFELPARFADGRVHRLDVIAGDGRALSPKPISFVAFEDGLAAFLARQSDVAAEQPRGAFYDQLMPQSLPFAALADWQRRFSPAPDAVGSTSIAVVLIGDADLDATLESLQDQGDGWIAGVMTRRGDTHEFDPADLVTFLDGEAEACQAVVFAPSGTTFYPGALLRLGQPILDDPTADCVYGDTILDLREGRQMPLAHAAFDRERMIEQGYAAGLFALRTDLARRAAVAGAGSLPRLFVAGSGIEEASGAAPLHVPGFLAKLPPLAHGPATEALLDAGRRLCANLDIQAKIEPVAAARMLPAIRLQRRAAPCVVSAIVLARNEPAGLRRCLAALKAQDTAHDLEIVVVCNDGAEGETGALLAAIAGEGTQVVRVSSPASVARSMNQGAASAGGSYLFFIDQNVTLTTPDALDEMLSRCSSQATGAVAGVLTWPSGAVYDGGLVLNVREGATRAFRGLAVGDAGYAETLLTAREVSAVSPSMMMVARDTFDAVGGMDEVMFPLTFPSVAFCLASAALGHRTVVTPYARAVWSGRTESTLPTEEGQARFDRELSRLRDRWPEALANDPFYSPLLNLDGQPHTALAWPPRDTAARRPRIASGAPDDAAASHEPAGSPDRRGI